MDEDDTDLPKMNQGKKVLLAIDGSKHSVDALEWYVDQLHKEPDTVIIAYSAEHHQHYIAKSSKAEDDTAIESPEYQTRKVFRAIDEIANKHRVKHMLQLLHEPLGESVLNSAKQQNVDLIIVGGRKHGRSEMGSTTNFVAFESDIPVLIYKYTDSSVPDSSNSKYPKRQRSESLSEKMKAILKFN